MENLIEAIHLEAGYTLIEELIGPGERMPSREAHVISLAPVRIRASNNSEAQSLTLSPPWRA